MSDKTKKIIAVVAGIGIILIFIILQIVSRPKPQPEPLPYIGFPSSTPVIKQPTSFPPTSPTPAAQTKTLEITKVLPIEDLSQQYFPIAQIQFTFSDPVEGDQFYFAVDPPAQATPYQKPGTSTIVLSPHPFWKKGVTTITVLPLTTSVTGSTLKKPFVYKIYTNSPAVDPEVP